MITVDTALESLKKYDISEADMLSWEKELQLEIPVDAYGRKQYSPHHINLFKNIRKHLALGRTLNEIQRLIELPPMQNSKPQAITQPAQAVVVNKSPYASVPRKPALQQPELGSGAANVVNLVQRLTREKDQLYKKLLETEKLNSHLYSANSLFNKKVREMAQQIGQLRENLKENENFKLLDDKAKLHKQLIQAEKQNQAKEEDLQRQREATDAARTELQQAQRRIQALTEPFDAQKFRGDWMETGHLVEVLYDNFGINVEPERVRLFRISELPTRMYGATAVINTTYQYETNALWKRNETLMVSYIDEETLEGELSAEYVLDGVPVAKAVYHVTCRRQDP